MDINAVRVADGEVIIAETGWEIFRQLLDVNSGR
jgi:altronate dehydratase